MMNGCVIETQIKMSPELKHENLMKSVDTTVYVKDTNVESELRKPSSKNLDEDPTLNRTEDNNSKSQDSENRGDIMEDDDSNPEAVN